MAQPASPPGAEHAAEQAHIPDTLPAGPPDELPPPPPDERPESPPGAQYAAEQAHIPDTLPAGPPDEVTLPTDHMSDVAELGVSHLPDWLILA
jgi:hypothetical protein